MQKHEGAVTAEVGWASILVIEGPLNTVEERPSEPKGQMQTQRIETKRKKKGRVGMGLEILAKERQMLAGNIEKKARDRENTGEWIMQSALLFFHIEVLYLC